MNVRDVNLVICEQKLPDDLTDSCYRVCSFCEKTVLLSAENARSCINLGGKEFYCPFCLRHDFHHRSARNVLIMSYRAIIGFYYHVYYIRQRTLWLSEIYRLIESHVRIGIQQPTMSYDPQTFLWFIDFNKIGNNPRQAPFNDVITACSRMLTSFGMKNHSLDTELEGKMWLRFALALNEFYKKRSRPADRRMLIPTLSGLLGYGEFADSKFHARVRKFSASSLKLV